MKRALTALVWLALGVCLIAVLALAGQKKTLDREAQEAQRKNQALQTLYDQAKEEWAVSSAAMKAQTEALTREKAQLNLELSALTAALNAAQTEIQARADAEQQAADVLLKAQSDWETQRAAMADQLTDAMAPLSPYISCEPLMRRISSGADSAPPLINRLRQSLYLPFHSAHLSFQVANVPT